MALFIVMVFVGGTASADLPGFADADEVAAARATAAGDSNAEAMTLEEVTVGKLLLSCQAASAE
jgi:hypothetical protein